MLRNHTDHIKLYIFIRAIPGLFSVYFRSFSIKLMSTCPSSIWCWDSKQRPSEHKPPPITTTPGFLTRIRKYFYSSGQMHCVPASLKGKYVIRFTVTSAKTTIQVSIFRSWSSLIEGDEGSYLPKIVKFGYCPS